MLFVTLEVTIRVFLGLGSPPLLQKDHEIGYLLKANQEVHRFGNQIYINEHHQRSSPVSDRKNRQRVLFVGDSVTFGGSLTDQEDTYPEQFGRLFMNKCHSEVDVLNASAGSWGIENRTAYLDRFGTFESDLVVIQIGARDLLQATSKSYVVGCHPSYPENSPTFAIGELFSRYIGPMWLGTDPSCDPKGERKQKPIKEQFEQNMNSLIHAIDHTLDQSTQVVILHTAERPNQKGEFTRNRWQGRFQQIMDSLSVEVIDLHQEWNGNSDAVEWYRDYIHINERGNKEVAQRLLPALVKRSYLSCKVPGEDEAMSVMRR